VEQARPHGFIANQKFSHWFSSSLRCYVRNEIYFYRHFKKNKSVFAVSFPSYCKLVKANVKSDKCRWLKPFDDNLKLQPKQMVKDTASFRKIS
jgi:hypothetical protein